MKTVHTLLAKSILLSFIIWMGSCSSTQKLIHQGRYDAAIAKSRRKLLKKNQKQKHVLALEEAFTKATDRDMNDVLAKLESNKIHDLEKILGIAYGIQNRQDRVEPLLPLASDKEGYTASFQFVKIGEIIDELEQKLFERYTEEGKQLLASGRMGNKSSARSAYDYFRKAKRLTDHPAINQFFGFCLLSWQDKNFG